MTPSTSTSEKTLVIVATYNEAENLPKLLDEIFLHAQAVDVLVVDDNSPDGEVVQTLASRAAFALLAPGPVSWVWARLCWLE